MCVPDAPKTCADTHLTPAALACRRHKWVSGGPAEARRLLHQ